MKALIGELDYRMRAMQGGGTGADPVLTQALGGDFQAYDQAYGPLSGGEFYNPFLNAQAARAAGYMDPASFVRGMYEQAGYGKPSESGWQWSPQFTEPYTGLPRLV